MKEFSIEKRSRRIIELDALSDGGKNQNQYRSDYIDVNTINLDQDETIYRIFDWDKLKLSLENKNLCLVRPKRWEDPFENFLLKSQGIYGGRPVSFENLRENYYGQCWTLRKECDGLWRNYRGESKSAFKVRSSVQKLMNYFYDFSNEFHQLNYFIGKVKYEPDTVIAEFFEEEIDISHSNGFPFIESLLIKRMAFSYEEEVRLIFGKPSSDAIDMSQILNPWNDSDFFFVSINPDDLFDEIELDPWLDSAKAKELETEIRALGYTGLITRSGLYKEPFFQARIK